ncbi:MAG: hypothetical protein KQH59_06420 [Desulfobulbaceae bacterium]|nr:hypothetical protein [Desulfobulbaceae bacterium]
MKCKYCSADTENKKYKFAYIKDDECCCIRCDQLIKMRNNGQIHQDIAAYVGCMYFPQCIGSFSDDFFQRKIFFTIYFTFDKLIFLFHMCELFGDRVIGLAVEKNYVDPITFMIVSTKVDKEFALMSPNEIGLSYPHNFAVLYNDITRVNYSPPKEKEFFIELITDDKPFKLLINYKYREGVLSLVDKFINSSRLSDIYPKDTIIFNEMPKKSQKLSIPNHIAEDNLSGEYEHLLSKLNTYTVDEYTLNLLDEIVSKNNLSKTTYQHLFFLKGCLTNDKDLRGILLDKSNSFFEENNNESVLIKNMSDFYRSSADSVKKDSCFIATCIYGDLNSREVIILRTFRDTHLLKSRVGTLFVKIYYTLSPHFVRLIEKKETVKGILKPMLDITVRVIAKFFLR